MALEVDGLATEGGMKGEGGMMPSPILKSCPPRSIVIVAFCLIARPTSARSFFGDAGFGGSETARVFAMGSSSRCGSWRRSCDALQNCCICDASEVRSRYPASAPG